MLPREIRGQGVLGASVMKHAAPLMHACCIKVNTTLIVAGIGGLINLIWMLVTLRMDNKIGAKIDSLKDWMEGRYVSLSTFIGHQTAVSIQHAEVERRLARLEVNGCDHVKAAK
jgi:hypothetical protein